jgi:hypothetical protein
MSTDISDFLSSGGTTAGFCASRFVRFGLLWADINVLFSTNHIGIARVKAINPLSPHRNKRA